MKRVLLILAALLPLLASALIAQTDTTVRVLIVTAHPDDETGFAATVYKITHDLRGQVDLALITNGEAGFKYSTLSESIYGLELTDEKVGRNYLPSIRKRELMSAGKIIGIRNYYFFDQQDNTYTLNVDSVFRHVWDIPLIKKRLHDIMTAGDYDYVFVLLPTEDTHAHHKGATILALETVSEMKAGKRPVILGGSVSAKNDTAQRAFTGLGGYKVTGIKSGGPSFAFDRTQKFGFRDRLDYRIIVNWEIAEHKSQGTMQTLMNLGELENFWYFDINDPAMIPATRGLFERLAVNRFPKKEY